MPMRFFGLLRVGDANEVFWVFSLFLVFFHESRLGRFLLGNGVNGIQ